MAIVWADGFDHYNTADALALSYPGVNPAIVAIGASQYARTGPGCFLAGASNGSGRLIRVVPERAIYGAQFSTFRTAYSYDDGDVAYIGVQFMGTDSAPQVMVHFTPDGRIAIYRGLYAELLYKSETVYQLLNCQQYWSVKILCANADAGSIEIRLGEGPNEQTIILLAGVTTSNGGTATIGKIALGRFYNNPRPQMNVYFDDYVLWNTDGNSNNDFLQSRRCRTTQMVSNDIRQDWHSNSGAPGWQEISHVPPDYLTWFLSSANSGDVSQFSMRNVPDNAIDVGNVFMVIQAKKDIATDVRLNVSLADALGNVAAAGNISLTTEIANYIVPVPLAPDGSNWTVKKLNDASARLTNES